MTTGHRAWRALATVAALSIGSALNLPPAAAQEQEAVASTFGVERTDGEDERLPGVEVRVEDADGQLIGTDASDAEGRVLVPLPGPGDYTVVLDTRTLPDQVEVPDTSNDVVEVQVGPGEVRQVLFALDDATPPEVTTDAVTSERSSDDGSIPWVVVAGALALVGLIVVAVLWRRRARAGAKTEL
jgi:hypothetical protein